MALVEVVYLGWTRFHEVEESREYLEEEKELLVEVGIQ